MALDFLSVQDTLSPLIAALEGLSGRRINSIIASTLTACAAEGQKEFKAQLPKLFDRPTAFTLNSTYIKAANAQNLVASVGFKDAKNGKTTPAGLYLQPQLYGGGGRHKGLEGALRGLNVIPNGWFATPGPSARLDAYGNMSGGEVKRIIAGVNASRQAQFRTLAGKRRGKALSNLKIFVVRVGEGRLGPGIYEYQGEGHGRAIKKLVNFVSRIHYKARFDMELILKRVLEQKAGSIFVQYAEASIKRLQEQALVKR